MTRVLSLAASIAIFGFFAFNYFFANPDLACAARGVETCSPKCGACSANVKGTWTFFEQGRDNSNVSGPTSLVLSQSGYQVKNTNEASITFVGTVFGSSIDFSITVSGEEIEGYVKHCEGHVLGNKKIFAVCDDRDSNRTTFTGQKN